MADSIATTTSVLGHPVHYQTSRNKNRSYKQRHMDFHICTKKFIGSQLDFLPNSGMAMHLLRYHCVPKIVKVIASELTKEAYMPQEDERIPRYWRDKVDSDYLRSRKLWLPSNKADDPTLHNPLVRQERLGCGWLGVIFEWEGVIVEDDSMLGKQAWLALAQEEGKPPPPTFILKRIEGMKNEQAISEILCWSRDPSSLRRLASRKEQIHRNLHGGFYQLRPGSREFISTLTNHKIPLAVVSTRPKKIIEEAIKSVGAEGSFDVIVGAEDVYRGKPDPEMFIYAAQQLNIIPERCILFGNSNSAVEAAHDARMKCVAVASKHPLYELSAADLVVRCLTELSIMDQKNLIAIESSEFEEEPEAEMEEEEDPSPSTSVATDDDIFR